MSPSKCFPTKILNHCVVLILPRTIICIEVQMHFSNPIIKKKWCNMLMTWFAPFPVETDSSMRVDLLWQPFSIYSKHLTFRGTFEIYWSKLKGDKWIMDLLGKIKTIMETKIFIILKAGFQYTCRDFIFSSHRFAAFHHFCVEGSLSSGC